MSSQKEVRFLLTSFSQERKISVNWCLIHSLFDDCVGAANKQESSVNHVITWDTQIVFTLQTPAIQHKTLTGILLSEKETLLYRKSKEERWANSFTLPSEPGDGT